MKTNLCFLKGLGNQDSTVLIAQRVPKEIMRYKINGRKYIPTQHICKLRIWLSEEFQKAKLQTSSEMVLSNSWKIDHLATANSKVLDATSEIASPLNWDLKILEEEWTYQIIFPYGTLLFQLWLATVIGCHQKKDTCVSTQVDHMSSIFTRPFHCLLYLPFIFSAI